MGQWEWGGGLRDKNKPCVVEKKVWDWEGGMSEVHFVPYKVG